MKKELVNKVVVNTIFGCVFVGTFAVSAVLTKVVSDKITITNEKRKERKEKGIVDVKYYEVE